MRRLRAAVGPRSAGIEICSLPPIRRSFRSTSTRVCVRLTWLKAAAHPFRTGFATARIAGHHFKPSLKEAETPDRPTAGTSRPREADAQGLRSRDDTRGDRPGQAASREDSTESGLGQAAWAIALWRTAGRRVFHSGGRRAWSPQNVRATVARPRYATCGRARAGQHHVELPPETRPLASVLAHQPDRISARPRLLPRWYWADRAGAIDPVRSCLAPPANCDLM